LLPAALFQRWDECNEIWSGATSWKRAARCATRGIFTVIHAHLRQIVTRILRQMVMDHMHRKKYTCHFLERQERQMVNHPGTKRCHSLSCSVTAFGNPSSPTDWQRDRRCQGKSAERSLFLVKQSIRRFPSSTNVGRLIDERLGERSNVRTASTQQATPCPPPRWCRFLVPAIPLRCDA
jgi:hypothetical protein